MTVSFHLEEVRERTGILMMLSVGERVEVTRFTELCEAGQGEASLHAGRGD